MYSGVIRPPEFTDRDVADGLVETIDVDLADPWNLVTFFRNDTPLMRGLRGRSRHLFDYYDWEVALGLDAAEAARVRKQQRGDAPGSGSGSNSSSSGSSAAPWNYVKAPEFRRQVVELIGEEVMLYEELFGFVVCRVRRNMVAWISECLSAMTSPDDLLGTAWPLQVQQLNPTEGRLTWIANKRTGVAGYVFEPTLPILKEHWTYVVWRTGGVSARRSIRPECAREVPLVSGMATRTFLTGTATTGSAEDEQSMLPAPFQSSRASDGRWRLHSDYRYFLAMATDLAEMNENVGDAESQLAHQRDYLLARPTREIAPDAIGEAVRQSTTSMAAAQAEEGIGLTLEGYYGLINMLESQRKQEITDFDYRHTPAAGTERLALAARRRLAMPTKHAIMAVQYGRPLPADGRQPFPDLVHGVSRQAPSVLRDPLVYEQRYKAAVVTHMGPLVTLADLDVFDSDLRQRSGPRSGSSGSKAGADGEGGEEVGSDDKAAALESLRQRASEFYSWMHALTFAWFDMQIFDGMFEALPARQRDLYFSLLVSRTPRDGDSAPTARTIAAVQRRLARATVRQGMVVAALEDAPAAADDDETSASMAAMRHVIWTRMAAREYVPATLVFDVERPSERAKRRGLREQERTIDDTTHARRLAEIGVLMEGASSGQIHNDDLRENIGTLLGLKTTRRPPPPAPDGAPPAKKKKKKGQ